MSADEDYEALENERDQLRNKMAEVMADLAGTKAILGNVKAERDEALREVAQHLADAERERADVVAYGRRVVEFAKTGMFTDQVDEMQAKALSQFIDHIERGEHVAKVKP